VARWRFAVRAALSGALFSALITIQGAAVSPGTSTRQHTTVWDGIYSDTQARRGEQIYQRSCGYCHHDDLRGGFFDNGLGRAPALAGARAFDSSFVERWKDATLADLVATVAATMPQQAPASLSAQAYVDVVCYLLSKNNVRSGPTDLPTDVDALQQIVIVQKQ
jgi:cytochrome c